MMIIYGLIIVLASICGTVIYRMGIRDGINMANGRKPDRLIPRKKFEADQEDKLSKGLQNILDVRNRHPKKESDISGTKTRG